jgi:hypothetical protein
VRVVTAPYVVVESGQEGEITMPADFGSNAERTPLPILGGKVKAFFVRPELNGSRVYYSLYGLVSAPGASGPTITKQSLRSNGALLGEFDLMEEHGLANGRKQAAVLTFELETLHAELPKQAPFIASLPQGAIELVAVCYHPSTNASWWKPDGSPTQEGTFDAMQGAVHAAGGMARGFLIRLISLPQDVSQPVWECDNAASMSSERRPYKFGQPVNNLRQAAITFRQPVTMTTLKFGFGWGQWETLVTEPSNATSETPAVTKDGHSRNVTWWQSSEKDGNAVFTVSHCPKTMANTRHSR